jgi:glycosyltransferase involved in cell wall biosynthesis
VITAFNDREDLAVTLEDLAGQTRAPGEVLIVDAGSTDGTTEMVSRWVEGSSRGRLLSTPGANISKGRNVGIQAAANERIACTDAGCRPAPGWIAALENALDEAGFVAGIWVVDGHTPFETCVGLALHPSPTDVELPGAFTRLSARLFGRRYGIDRATGRSMAFTKSGWAAVGGFPENLYAGEDVTFSRAMTRYADRAVLAPEAVVAWRPHRTWLETAQTYRRYARGDVRLPPRHLHLVRAAGPVGLIVGVLAMISVGLPGYLILTLALALTFMLAALYLALPFRRARASGLSSRKYAWRIPLIVVVKDASSLIGAIGGIWDMLRRRPQPSPPRAPRTTAGRARPPAA